MIVLFFPQDMFFSLTTNVPHSLPHPIAAVLCQVITASAGTAQTSSYTVEGSAATPLVASIVADAAAAAAALKPVEGSTLPKAIAVAVTTAAGADSTVVPPNVTAPSSSETITRAVSVDVSAATVQAVQAAIEAARQQGSLPYTMRLRNNPPKPA